MHSIQAGCKLAAVAAGKQFGSEAFGHAAMTSIAQRRQTKRMYGRVIRTGTAINVC